MGAVCAVVYLLCVIFFIPFPFYKDIMAATSIPDMIAPDRQDSKSQMGRVLHKFPHSKAGDGSI